MIKLIHLFEERFPLNEQILNVIGMRLLYLLDEW